MLEQRSTSFLTLPGTPATSAQTMFTLPCHCLHWLTAAAPGDPVPTHPVSDFTNAAVVGSIDSFTIEFAVKGLPVGVIGGTGTNLISAAFWFHHQWSAER